MAKTVRQNRIKKLLALILALAMTAGLLACSGEGAAESGAMTDDPGQQTASSGESGSGTGAADGPERVLEVGFGKVCVTPTQAQMDAGILLGGGKCKGKLDDIYAIALAFRDEEGSLFIHVVVDMNTARIADSGNYTTSLNLGDLGRRAVTERLGISPDRVTVGATHNHSYVKYGVNDEPNRQWRETVLMPGMADAAQAAVDDLASAEIYTGKTATSKLTFVRRYWLSDGTFYDGYKEKRDSEIVSHESDPDEEIQLVRFVRGAKRDILLVNWQSHATKVTSSAREISADYVGPLRDQVEAELDVNCVFYQGAAGNLAPGSRVAGETAIPDSGWEAAKKLGKAVAAYVIDACDSGALHRVKAGLLRTERKVVTAQVKKYAEIGDPLYNDALKVTEYAKSASNNYETAAYAAQFGIETVYHARAIIENAKQRPTKDYELNVISIGDVAFVTLPMEFFDTLGMQIKDGSSFDTTVLLGYTCGAGKYMADKEACTHGGYETYNTWFADGTGEEAVGEYIELLGAVYPERFGN